MRSGEAPSCGQPETYNMGNSNGKPVVFTDEGTSKLYLSSRNSSILHARLRHAQCEVILQTWAITDLCAASQLASTTFAYFVSSAKVPLEKSESWNARIPALPLPSNTSGKMKVRRFGKAREHTSQKLTPLSCTLGKRS